MATVHQIKIGTTTYDIEDSTARAMLPTVTTTDNGKFLRVVDGAWAAATVNNAEDNKF